MVYYYPLFKFNPLFSNELSYVFIYCIFENSDKKKYLIFPNPIPRSLDSYYQENNKDEGYILLEIGKKPFPISYWNNKTITIHIDKNPQKEKQPSIADILNKLDSIGQLISKD